MSTTTIATKCPEWCTSKEIEDHADDGHDGPKWPSLPIEGGFYSFEMFVGADTENQITINVCAPHMVTLTAEEALQAGRNLIEAAQWASAHGVA